MREYKALLSQVERVIHKYNQRENQKQNYISHVKKHKEMQKLETSEEIEKTQGEK